jgi:hypothetical protein
MQFSIVKLTEKSINNYSRDTDPNLIKLFEVARPLVLKKMTEDSGGDLRREYQIVEPYFLSVALCVEAGACDTKATVLLLAEEMQAFYNAVCPYHEELERTSNNQGDSAHILSFLINVAHYTNIYKDYFCRERVIQLLPRTAR